VDTLQSFIRTDQADDARIFVAPSTEAEFLCRRFAPLLAPEPGAETWGSRLIAIVAVAPFSQFALFSFDLQAFLYQVFHQRLLAKVTHLLLMPVVNFFIMASLAQVWFGTRPSTHGTILLGANLAVVYAALLATWYVVLAVRAGMVAWGLVMIPIVAGLCVAANVYYGHVFDLDASARSFFSPTPLDVNPWLGAVAAAALIAFSHGPERELPPRVTGKDTWLSIVAFLGGEQPIRQRAVRILMFAAQPVLGTANEFVGSARLMPYGVLMRMFQLGYRPAVRARLRDHVARAVANGNPALDYVGVGGGTRLNAAVFRAPAAAPINAPDAVAAR
jgi:uncharacterized membrane protein YGL010W